MVHNFAMTHRSSVRRTSVWVND